MIVQEPVQAAIWHCLNHYDYNDAIFLSERLYAEVKTDDSLFLLATAYYRNGQIDDAYHILKDKAGASYQCRYLLGSCAYEMQRYAEAESALTDSTCNKNNLDELITEYEDQAAFVLLLLAKISTKTGRRHQAIDAYKRALKLNPFLWSSFESMCSMGEKPNPNIYFQLSELENLSHCHGTNLSNIESIYLTAGSTPSSEIQQHVTPAQHILNNHPPTIHVNSSKLCTPDEMMSPLARPLCMSGFELLPVTRTKSMRLLKVQPLPLFSPDHSPSFSPSFGYLLDKLDEFSNTPNLHTQPTLTEVNEQKSFSKKVRAHVGNLINRKEPILQNSKPVFSQTSNVNNSIPISPITPAPLPTGQNVRRSSRLFSNSYSVKENNKSPNRNKFATPKSPSRKTKQRLAKCSLNEFNSYMDLNAKNRIKKEKAETVTSTDIKSNSAISGNTTVAQLQKQSAEGLMCLLRDLGLAFQHLSQFNCKSAIEELMSLPPQHLQTSWVYSMLGLAYFEMADYENSVKYFGEVRNREPYRMKYMDIYSTALWHLQKEVALSALAQDLIQLSKNSPITWIVSGNCFSLHKEHDTAIKFLHRAVQVDPSLPYAYTLLGHEYMMTEELDKAMSCYRNAIRLDPRHYNAWFGIGTIYSKQERFHLAEIHYNRALAINPHSSVIMCHIGVVQHALKKTDKALKTLNTAISNAPKNALCKFHRGQIYFAIGRHSEALKEFEELKEIVPKESLVYYLIGKVHKKLGNTDLALMYFSWATDLDPKGASSQIKEAFEPSIGRGVDAESPASPPVEEYPLESNSAINLEAAFVRLQDDSDDSL